MLCIIAFLWEVVSLVTFGCNVPTPPCFRCWSKGPGLCLSRNNRRLSVTTTCSYEITSWTDWTGWLTPGAGNMHEIKCQLALKTTQPGCVKTDVLSDIMPSRVGATAWSWLMRWGWGRPSRPSPSCPTCFTSTSCTDPSCWWSLCQRSPPGRGSLTPGLRTWTWWSTLVTWWAGKRYVWEVCCLGLAWPSTLADSHF